MQFSPLLKNTEERPWKRVWPLNYNVRLYKCTRLYGLTYFTAFARSQSPNITNGLLPPSSSVHFFRLDEAHAFMMCLPTAVDPVNPSFRTNGWSAIACPVNDPVPVTTLITPGGNPARTVSSANLSAVNGHAYWINTTLYYLLQITTQIPIEFTWAGLITTVLPAARHADIFHESIIKG